MYAYFCLDSLCRKVFIEIGIPFTAAILKLNIEIETLKRTPFISSNDALKNNLNFVLLQDSNQVKLDRK